MKPAYLLTNTLFFSGVYICFLRKLETDISQRCKGLIHPYIAAELGWCRKTVSYPTRLSRLGGDLVMHLSYYRHSYVPALAIHAAVLA
jgi:hypothetical protein